MGPNSYGLVRRVGQPLLTIWCGPSRGLVPAGAVDVDGFGANARFNPARRMASDGSSLFIGDAFAVRRMVLATGAVVTGSALTPQEVRGQQSSRWVRSPGVGAQR